jgi:N-acetyl-alpha-D-glucosaminyl L-malate synthase BshA
VIVHVSNFRSVKRVPEVVQIFAKIRRQIPAVLVLVGDGPDRDRAENEAERLGLRSQVRFLGTVDAIADVMHAADLFILPSSSESFGLSALEAMACGVPVVASRVGGLPEVVLDGETGYLIDPSDIDGYAEAAIRILSDQERWAQFRENAVKRSKDFASDLIVPRYEALYRRMIA